MFSTILLFVFILAMVYLVLAYLHFTGTATVGAAGLYEILPGGLQSYFRGLSGASGPSEEFMVIPREFFTGGYGGGGYVGGAEKKSTGVTFREDETIEDDLVIHGMARFRGCTLKGKLEVHGDLTLVNTTVAKDTKVVGTMDTNKSTMGTVEVRGLATFYTSDADTVKLCGKIRLKGSNERETKVGTIKVLNKTKECLDVDDSPPVITIKKNASVGKIDLPKGMDEATYVSRVGATGSTVTDTID